MSVLYILVPLAVLLASTGVAAFFWAVRTGQFDDVETPAIRILLDDEQINQQQPPENKKNMEKKSVITRTTGDGW